jgi:hypothetical protein
MTVLYTLKHLSIERVMLVGDHLLLRDFMSDVIFINVCAVITDGTLITLRGLSLVFCLYAGSLAMICCSVVLDIKG